MASLLNPIFNNFYSQLAFGFWLQLPYGTIELDGVVVLVYVSY